MAQFDPHSYHDSTQPSVKEVFWKARVDFDRQWLHAEATLTFAHATVADGLLDLDTRDLDIEEVQNRDTRQPLSFTMAAPDPILGAKLSITLPKACSGVVVRYKTSAQASALQWLSPEQTSGGKAPFLFSQCQAIHARSVLPIQDTPRVRFRYRAEMTVPRHLKALMAAAFVNRVENKDWAQETYEMPQPIPPYLFAFVVGNLVEKQLSPRSSVWAEPEVIDAAAWEFSDVEKMMQAAEALFGPYDWERFDLVTMPPSFPYGGMENPRLTFLTPTLLAKDKSLVNVLAHELAHSWTGNLVTNANAEHFWLNEGFTVFAELRILEALEGVEQALLHAAIGQKSLEEAIARFSKKPQLTRLRNQLAGVDPDDAFSEIPYVKGYLFLKTLENTVGRKAFDTFLKTYLHHFRFQSITTEDFIEFLDEKLPGALEKMNGHTWLYDTGLPDNTPRLESVRLNRILNLKNQLPEMTLAREFSPMEWKLYFDAWTSPMALDTCQKLDETFHFTDSGNHEVLCSWLALTVQSNYPKAIEKTQEVLSQVGRMKYLRPLYGALLQNPQTKALAVSCYEKSKRMYHPIARQMVEGLFRSRLESAS